jgi:hypothetical protein
MAGFSDYLEKGIIRWLFKSNLDAQATPAVALASSGPTDLYLSLHGGDPSDTGASELSGNGYARVHVAKDANDKSGSAVTWTQSAASGTAWGVTNVNAVVFVAGSGPWNGGSVIKWFGLWDAVTTGNFLMGGTINGSTGVPDVLAGVGITFAAGQLAFTAD